jgi:hypothetical protein
MTAEAIASHLQGDFFIFGRPILPDTQTQIAARVRQVAERLRERFAEESSSRYKDQDVQRALCLKTASASAKQKDNDHDETYASCTVVADSGSHVVSAAPDQ